LIVLDASAAIDLLLARPAAERIGALIFAAGESLHAPHVLDVEIAQVLRRMAAAGEIEGGRGREALTDLADLRLRRYAHDLFLPRIWSLRHNMTAYDAAYAALAEALGAVLLTRDARLAAAAGGMARIELV
jgi:predicted nucleic acid-binding protein